MGLLDWFIVLVPLVFVIYMAYRSRQYIRGVADFLAAGRICGRYVIAVAGVSVSLSVMNLVANAEVYYKTGFAISFWNNILLPISMVLALSGFCYYRFRETKALSLGQFLEMRYSRSLRIFASGLRTFSEIITNMICPAISARFFIYLLGFPNSVELGGVHISVFALVILLVLVISISIIWMGGTLALLITDTIQSLLSYPIFTIFVIFILLNFSWTNQIIPVMTDRIQGESFINPFDIKTLRDFNLFALVVTVFTTILNHASWIGAGTTTAGKTPHEQKMAGILGTWRNGFSLLFYFMVAAMLLVVLNHRDFSEKAKNIRVSVSSRVTEELVGDPSVRKQVLRGVRAIPAQSHVIGTDQPLSQNCNLDTPYFESARNTLGGTPEGNAAFQEFRTLYNQMLLPAAMREILPGGMIGLFCLLMIMLMISTDSTRIFSSSITIVQDVVLPTIKSRQLTSGKHILLLRCMAVCVGILFFCGSFFMSQLDYINLFCIIMTSIWLGGAGPVIVFGLYSRMGNTAGAFCSLLTGTFVSTAGILLQRNWASGIYPWLATRGWVVPMDHLLQFVSAPFRPYIEWQMNPVKFPINSMEIFFIAMLLGIGAYWIGSFLSLRRPFNLNRMLHRGKYNLEGVSEPEKITFRNILGKLVGITPQYTFSDRIITWSVFGFTFLYQFGLTFLAVLVFNFFSPWSMEGWGKYFLIVFLIVPAFVAAVSTVWFTIGGIIDLRRMFRDLKNRIENPLDNGQVEGHISLADVTAFQKLDNSKKEKEAEE